MFTSIKRGVAMATAAGVLGVAGIALAAGPASAFTLRYGSSTGATVPAGKKFAAVSTAPAQFTQTTSSTVLANCQTSSLSGTTTAAAGLSVTGGSFSNCHIGGTTTGTSLTVTPSFSPAWGVVPTSNPSTNVFAGYVSNVSVTVGCPSNQSSTYKVTSGLPGLPATEQNQFSGGLGSRITLTNSVSLTKQAGGTCAFLPNTVRVSAAYALSQLAPASSANLAPVSASNNLWENN